MLQLLCRKMHNIIFLCLTRIVVMKYFSNPRQENEKNDDECYVCKGEEEEAELVVCDHCPRSFHQKCHLPHVDDTTLR